MGICVSRGHRDDQTIMDARSLDNSAISAKPNPSSFSPPTFGECGHGGLARGLVAVGRLPFPMMPVGQRPQPRRSLRSSVGLHNAAHHDAVGDHVVIVLAPFAGGTARRRALEDQRGHWHSASASIGAPRTSRRASRIISSTLRLQIESAIPLRRALSDPNLLGNALPSDSWMPWRTLLIAAMGEELAEGERELFKRMTGRDHTSSASLGWVASGCAGLVARKTSSRWQPSPKTCAGSQS